MHFDPDKTLVVRWGKRTRHLPPGTWWIDKGTPLGEDADIYERKPFGGRKLIERAKIIGQA